MFWLLTIALGSHICYWIGTKLAMFIEDLPQMHPTKFQFIWQSGFRGKDFLEITGAYFFSSLTCPFGQLTKNGTCPTQSFSCPKKLIKITKTRD
jgi:hypothetical protein